MKQIVSLSKLIRATDFESITWRGHVQFTKLMINATNFVCGLKFDILISTKIFCWCFMCVETCEEAFRLFRSKTESKIRFYEVHKIFVLGDKKKVLLNFRKAFNAIVKFQ